MLPAFVINLERSPARWLAVAADAGAAGVEAVRVEAIDGRNIPPAHRPELDVSAFARLHGHRVLDGEYGCYRSHLAALSAFRESDSELALIAEDDIHFTPELGDRVRRVFEAGPQIDVLKLVNHRTVGFIRHGISGLGDEFGRCLHGPSGSAACYAVTRVGAARLAEALVPMRLPYDIALERGWATGARTFTTRQSLVTFQIESSATTIGSRRQYRAARLPRIKQITTAAFRATDYARRVAYALRVSTG